MNPAYYVSSGAIKLAVYTWGVAEPNKPTIVLVHGYPDSAHVWQNVAQALAKNYFVVTYDVRGAGLSSKPIKVKDDDLSLLSADLVAVLDSLPNTPKVHLVGHDWGAIQSWESVTEPKLQARLLSFTAISGPCLDHMGFWMQQRLGVKAQSMKQVLRQLAHSWYIVFFQIPVLAPAIWRNFGNKMWPWLLKNQENIHGVQANPTQAQDGEYGVNLYKANMLPRVMYPRERHSTVPTQIMVVTDDHFMIPDIWQGVERWLTDVSLVEMTGGHWLILNKSTEFAAYVQQFVAKIEKKQSNAIN